MQLLITYAERFGGAGNTTFVSLKGMFDQVTFE
jgi:hypothetical protein